MSLANTKQVDGNHYQPKIGTLQVWDWIEENGLGYLEGCAIKYICRCNAKYSSPKADLEKAVHYLEKFIELIDKGVRKPRQLNRQVTYFGVKDVCDAYELDDQLFEILFFIFYWDSDGDLGVQSTSNDIKTAIKLLKEYIKNHDSAATI